MTPDRAAQSSPSRDALPARPALASEDVILSAPMSFSGSARRIARLRRRARDDRELAMLTAATVALTALAWVFVFVWYCMWGLLLIPYRVIRRRDRRQRLETLRHRELLDTLHASTPSATEPEPDRSGERIGDAERERVVDVLRDHALAGRLSADEFEERLGAAHRARTRGDLADLQADLPHGG